MNSLDPVDSGVSLQTVFSTRSKWICNVHTFTRVIHELIKHLVNLRPIPPHKKDYYPRYIAGRGVGLYAARSFEVGETIIIERPKLIAARSIHCDTRMLEHLWDRMSAEDLLNLSLLSNRFKDDPTMSRTWEQGVLNTNSFGFPLPTPHWKPQEVYTAWPAGMLVRVDAAWVHSMLFLDAARLNHSCSPNTTTSWNEYQIMLRIRAVKSIRAGEEITIGYIPLTLPQAERQSKLIHMYDFKCDCVACHLPEEASNARRKRLDLAITDQALFDRFRNAEKWTRSDVLKVQEKCRQILRLAEEEGLGLLIRTLAIRQEWLAFTYGLLGDEDEFEAQTKEALWTWEANVGQRAGDLSLEALRDRLADFKRAGPSAIPHWGFCAQPQG